MNNRILAKVGGLAIMESEVEEMVMTLRSRGQNYDHPQGRAAILEQLIANKLLLIEAQKNLYEHNAAFKAQLEKVKEDMLINFAASKVLDEVKDATEEEVKKYYNDNMDNFQKGESVNASHILVDSEEKANEILAKINAGEVSFEDAARENSTCPSKDNGGNLGEFTRGQMVPEFDEAVFSMEVGTVSAPVKTQFGYHLIKLVSKSEASTYAFDEIKTQLTDMVNQEKKQSAFQSKINQLKILYPVDKF